MKRLPGDPGFGKRVLYSIGFRLPPENREWVRHELTDAGWRGRIVMRHLVIMVPICVVLALLPGPPWLRVMVPALAFIGSIGGIALYASELRVNRLRQHSLPVPDDPDLGRPSH